jgi:hypothetical protein
MYIREEIPHAGIIMITTNVFIFLGTWFLIHKWMIKTAKKKQGPREGSIHHKKGN